MIETLRGDVWGGWVGTGFSVCRIVYCSTSRKRVNEKFTEKIIQTHHDWNTIVPKILERVPQNSDIQIQIDSSKIDR